MWISNILATLKQPWWICPFFAVFQPSFESLYFLYIFFPSCQFTSRGQPWSFIFKVNQLQNKLCYNCELFQPATKIFEVNRFLAFCNKLEGHFFFLLVLSLSWWTTYSKVEVTMTNVATVTYMSCTYYILHTCTHYAVVHEFYSGRKIFTVSTVNIHLGHTHHIRLGFGTLPKRWQNCW